MAQKNIAKVGLAELAKRVPPNQALEFQNFKAKHTAFQARVNKQPDKLPAIDFDFYRINVRPESKKWVDEFQQKYKEVCEKFDAREKQDYTKYYAELEKVCSETKANVEKFKAESDARIKDLEAEYERIKCLKPYEEMTVEEYCDLLPDKKMYTFEGHPSFWPHNPEEQSLEPAAKGHGHDDHGADDGRKNPPKNSNGGNTAGGAPPASSAPSATPAECVDSSESKGTKAESKGDAKAIEKYEQNSVAKASRSNEVEEPDLPQKYSNISEKEKKEAELAKMVADEEMKHQLVLALLEDKEPKDRQATTEKK